MTGRASACTSSTATLKRPRKIARAFEPVIKFRHARGPQPHDTKSLMKPGAPSSPGRVERTLMKLVVDKSTDRVLGAHMVGPDAGEITQGLGVALTAGATKAQFDATIGIHPTAAEEFVTMREMRETREPAQ